MFKVININNKYNILGAVLLPAYPSERHHQPYFAYGIIKGYIYSIIKEY